MMVETKTRTQRRMERKQALILLVLVLIVSLSSFTLGVMVGRRGAERDMAQSQSEQGRIMVADSPSTQSATGVGEQIEGAPAEEEKLTFYDNLSRGETVPLGSGINLPPEEEPVTEPPSEVQVPATLEVAKVSPQAESQPRPGNGQASAGTPEIPKEIPRAAAGGTYSVQVGSFSSVADAGRLKKSLMQKGYPVFIAEADLGAKGIWYRVRLGPFADAEEAKTALTIADKKDNIKGFVSRL
ncbi:MAG TPA: SPOR domain-containing protein [Geopsychrobacteraceae bacterium]|nr:SPOR domain-containing protein [Geopsychrobacteraceae bacterium]